MHKIIFGTFIGMLSVIGLIALSVVFILPTYLLWNWLMPSLFNLGEITWLQALGLNLLSAILFKSTSSKD